MAALDQVEDLGKQPMVKVNALTMMMLAHNWIMEEGRRTNLPISSLLISFVYARSRPRNAQFLSNGSIAKVFRSTMSLLPISTIVPPSAVSLHDSSNSSPTKELRMTSQPRPPVARRISSANFPLREENMRFRGMPKLLARNSRLSSVPTVTKICALLHVSLLPSLMQLI